MTKRQNDNSNGDSFESMTREEMIAEIETKEKAIETMEKAKKEIQDILLHCTNNSVSNSDALKSVKSILAILGEEGVEGSSKEKEEVDAEE